MVENTTVSSNHFGLVAGGTNAGMLVSNSSIVLNAFGVFITSGGTVASYKNNNLNANPSSDGTFTGIIGQQ